MNVKELLKNGARIENLPLKVVFYARVSIEHEEQSTSITNQIDFFKNYINKNPKWTLINSYIDEGISGKNTVKRKEFLKMICDAKRKEFDLILTKSVSRFARNTIDSIYYTELLSQNGIGVYFFNDNYYVIARKGDTFRSIAQDAGISYSRLASFNERDKHDPIEEGERIWLKKKRRKAPKEYKNRPHQVRAGESMYSISQQYGIRLKNLYKINDLPPEYSIRVGDFLLLR